ncbi:hypothetical protein AB0M29_44970 [Streptomyces sp. NPDC051976]|uniref:hypothetical protein n=1 Tax=Streptomyces sp. NPDC051976 TaxID=3154947 RepID=UPI00342296BF
MEPKATESRPEPERLLAAQVTTTDDGGVQMVIHTQAADGTFYDGVLVTNEPYVTGCCAARFSPRSPSGLTFPPTWPRYSAAWPTSSGERQRGHRMVAPAP